MNEMYALSRVIFLTCYTVIAEVKRCIIFFLCSAQAVQQKSLFLTNQCQEYLQRVKMILQSVSAPHHRFFLLLLFFQKFKSTEVCLYSL